jgi:2-polyprenyl-3-methyl-5-hydroxy-6-metoxy-1,4-benzoquinol methylase
MQENSVFEKVDTVTAWDADYYPAAAEKYYDLAIARMLQMMEVQPGASVLDAGCGTGVHSIRVARLGYTVCTIDFSERMLAQARVRVRSAGLAAMIDFRREDLTRLSFPERSFRNVFSWGVIIHIREVEKALDNLARIVQPGGSLALYVTNRTAWDRHLERAARTVLRRPLVRESHFLGEGVWYKMHGENLWLWHFNIPALEKHLKTLGFRRTHRVTGEFSEIQRRASGKARDALLHFNNMYHRLALPPGPASTNLLVFRKEAQAAH